MSHKFKLYSNANNSCYMDTLLSILFYANSGFLIKKILKQRTSVIDYPKTVCTTKSTIGNLTKYASEVQKLFETLYNDAERKVHSCDMIEKLSECNTEMSLGEFTNVAEVYSLICDLFPALKITYQRSESDKIYIREQCMFDVTDITDIPSYIVSEPPFYVFSNGGIERGVAGLIDWKEKGFDFEIFGGTYVLVGAILHVGLAHYTSVFLDTSSSSKTVDEDVEGGAGDGGGDCKGCCEEGKWYFYDDGRSATPLPVSKQHVNVIFKDSPRIQPAMFFYVKKNYLSQV